MQKLVDQAVHQKGRDHDNANNDSDIDDAEGVFLSDIMSVTLGDVNSDAESDVECIEMGDYPRDLTPACPPPNPAKLVWELPAHLCEDRLLMLDLTHIIPLARESDLMKPRILFPTAGLPAYHFEQREFRILETPTALLNDVCINGGAALLQHLFSAPSHPSAMHSQRCALLSTFTLVKIRHQASSDDLWRCVRHSYYWQKDVWILPIHRPQQRHWVLCCLSFNTRELFLFDSLASRKAWCADLHDIATLLDRLASLANQQGHPFTHTSQGWVARPLVVRMHSAQQ